MRSTYSKRVKVCAQVDVNLNIGERKVNDAVWQAAITGGKRKKVQSYS